MFCSKPKSHFPTDYRKYVKETAELFCKEIVSCSFSQYRTIPKKNREAYTLTACIQELNKSLDVLIPLQDDNLKMLIFQCFEKRKKMLGNCEKFINSPISISECSLAFKRNAFLLNQKMK